MSRACVFLMVVMIGGHQSVVSAEAANRSATVVVTNLAPNPVATLLLQVDVFPFAIHNVTFSPDGKKLATGEGFGDVRLWHSESGVAERSVRAHNEWGFAFAWLPGAKQFATGGGDNLIHIFDSDGGDKPAKTLARHTNDVHAVVIDSTGKILVSAGDDARILLWELPGGELLSELLGHEKQIPALAISPNDRWLASGSRDDTIRFWDLGERRLLTILRGHTNDVMSVKFSPDGNLLASGSYDGTVRLWDIPGGKLRNTLTGHTSWIYGVAFSPDGRQLASAGDHSLRLWDVETGTQRAVREFHGTIKSPRGAQREHISSVAWHPTGSKLAAGSTSGRAYVVDATSLETLLELSSPRIASP